ncbi:MAG TPA: plasmid replication initiator TrfA [Anaerovoracaceae bacterium]|nr:plasmid replication initiator TrfA [Anaerovoracaceae bacterium]
MFRLKRNGKYDVQEKVDQELPAPSVGELKATHIPQVVVGMLKPQRYFPNFLNRCAIFGIVRGGSKRKYISGKVVSFSAKYTIYYTGAQLSQFDADVFQVIANLWTKANQPAIMETSLHHICANMGKFTKGDTKKYISDSIERLAASSLKVITDDFKYIDKLFSIVEEIKTGRVILSFNEKFMGLMTVDYCSLQSVNERNELDGELTKWLYNFYSTHKEELHCHRINDLKSWCGSTMKIEREFKRSLKKSLDQLLAKGYIKNFSFDVAIDGETLVKVTPRKVSISGADFEIVAMLKKTPSSASNSVHAKKKAVPILPGGKPLT